MNVYRISISSWTSSFRYPNIISGYQPTLDVPPISTVLGMLNACSGKYINHRHLQIGYYFDYEAKPVDLETIYQIENKGGFPSSQVKPNVLSREFLFNCRLIIYLTDSSLANLFKEPYYPILLGRSNDMATVDKIEELVLTEVQNANKIKGQIIPFAGNYLPGVLQALPKYFTDTIPRKNIGTEAYSIIPYNSDDFPTNLTAYRDVIDNKEVDIYFHNLNFVSEEGTGM